MYITKYIKYSDLNQTKDSLSLFERSLQIGTSTLVKSGLHSHICFKSSRWLSKIPQSESQTTRAKRRKRSNKRAHPLVALIGFLKVPLEALANEANVVMQQIKLILGTPTPHTEIPAVKSLVEAC